jgi:hypothetical protein
MRVYLLAGLTLVFSTTLLAAPTTKKAASQPAGESDGSGPRAALLLMDKMTQPGKPETALPFYHVTATRERVFANHLAEMDAALATLHKSAANKFGKAAADVLVKAADGTTVADINAAKIRVDGDRAKVWFSGDLPTEMVRVGDDWRISVKQWVRGAKNLPALRSSFSKLASRVNDVAKGIETGRYATADAARTEIEKAKKEAFQGSADEDDDDDDDE